MNFLSMLGRNLCIGFLCCMFSFDWSAAQTKVGVPTAGAKTRDEYTELLPRVEQGDMHVDLRAFRIDGATLAGSAINAAEVADRESFKKLMAASNPRGALEFSNRTLALDYASAIGHFDAMMAERALNHPKEAVKHEKVLNALLDSMAESGDGKGAETAYLAVTTQEEYVFMALRLKVKAHAQSLIARNGHFYDRLEFINPATNATEFLWFNADIQINPAGRLILNSATVPVDPSAVVASAPNTIPAGPVTNRALTQGGISGNSTSNTKAPDHQPSNIETSAQPPAPQTLYEKNGVTVIATETQDTLDFSVSEPDSILVSIEVDRNQNGQFDRLVDVAYRPQSNGNLCPQYLLDSQHNTPCGGFASLAQLKDFNDEHSRRRFVLVLPKMEISFNRATARLAFVFRDNALQRTFFYPIERFQKAIEFPFSIKALVGTRAESVKRYAPMEEGFWSHSMKINVTRTDAGAMYHFFVNFTVPDPPIHLNSPSPYPFTLIYIYGDRMDGASRVNVPQDMLPSIAGDWKANDQAHFEFDLPKEYADPSQGWSLRFCIGSKSGCTPSSNLLVSSNDILKPRLEKPHIRVENRSDVNFMGVVVNGRQFGNIKAGTTSDYQTLEYAYKYASVTLSTGSGPMEASPIDYLGERRLSEGNYTYVLRVQDGRLQIECVVN